MKPPLKSKQRARHAAIGRWSAIPLLAAGLQILPLPPLHAAEPEPPVTAKHPAASELPATPENASPKVMKITDSGITAAIEGGLKSEKGVFPNDVNVGTSQGIVTLSGSGGNILAKERAVKIAESFRGVLGVIDLISVTPSSRPDGDISKDALAALKQDPATETYQLTVTVKDGVATLGGSAGSNAERQLAAQIVKGIEGIKDVHNDVQIDYMAKRTDAEITADVEARLQWDLWINGNMIKVAVKDGNVTLTGSIGSVLARSQALDDAWLNGVMSVDASAVKIEAAAGDDAHRKLNYAVRSDSEIQKAVQDALHLDPRVSAFAPDVTVEGGEVLLSGSVGNLKAEASAVEDARGVVSVLGVESLMKVRPKQRSTDAEMQQELKAALAWDPDVDSYTIDVAVINRVAYLSGTVDSSFPKRQAQDVASKIQGVVKVVNHLKIEQESPLLTYDWPYDSFYGLPYYGQTDFISEDYVSPPYLSDERIKEKITDSFFWSPFVHFDDVKVTVNGGVAILSGTVGTTIGWREADRDAHKSGATAVLNHVVVKKGSWF